MMIGFWGPTRWRDWKRVLQEEIDSVTETRPIRVELHLYPADGAGLFAVSAPSRRILFPEARRRMADLGCRFESEQKDLMGWNPCVPPS